MPSHPERVRRNYVTATLHVVDDRSRQTLGLQFFVTKGEIASWASPRMVIAEIWRQIGRQFESALTRPDSHG
jgi:hypothetical protein